MNDARHPFDIALELSGDAPELRRATTSDAYWNMVSPFGGVTAAIMLKAMLDHPRRVGDPLQFTINYLGPMVAGDYDIGVELLRANRGNQHWAMRLVQGGETLVHAVAICATRRDTWAHTEAQRPQVPAAADCPPTPPRRETGFLQRYEFRFAHGKPFADNEDSLSHVWVRDVPPRPLDFPSLTAICDSFLPRIFLRRREFVPIGTVSMNIYFHAGAATLARQGDASVLTSAQGQVFAGGYFDQHGQVWGQSEGGTDTLLAATQQIVWYKQ